MLIYRLLGSRYGKASWRLWPGSAWSGVRHLPGGASSSDSVSTVDYKKFEHGRTLWKTNMESEKGPCQEDRTLKLAPPQFPYWLSGE